MADSPITMPIKLMPDGSTGIHTGDQPIGIEITHVRELVDQVVNQVTKQLDQEISTRVANVSPDVHHLAAQLHTDCLILTVAGIFLFLLLVVIAVALIVCAASLHKIAKQGEGEYQIDAEEISEKV
ncbi:hypothetical protein FAI40_03395 [Acetobacteraceae bacterium]|nr:hypothetical protein FAI40_03395 [Acetobacteraceae bacterium]